MNPIDAGSIRAHEWIGLKVKIVETTDPGLKGISGTVEDETKNMFAIKTERKTVMVQKKKTVFLVELPDTRTVKVEGGTVKFRPEDRVKKGLGRW